MTTANKMLERALSVRRSPHATDDVAFFDDGAADETGDESKTRKHISMAMRLTNFLTRTGYLWPILVIGLLIVIILSVIINSRDLVCISASNSDHVSRLKFFGFDALESDFGSLGVPWCKFYLFFIIFLFFFGGGGLGFSSRIFTDLFPKPNCDV